MSCSKGEILGFSGLVGAGRSELAKAICGLYPKKAGEVIFKGSPLNVRNYEDAIRQGIVYLTEDRKTEGLFLEMPISNNIAAMNLKQVSSRGLIDGKRIQTLSSRLADKLNIKYHTLVQLVSSLSGGNQQKVLIAKLLSVNPAIIIMDEPTRGIDVGAKSEIHRLLRELAGQGIGVIMISSELPEIIGMCDRVTGDARGSAVRHYQRRPDYRGTHHSAGFRDVKVLPHIRQQLPVEPINCLVSRTRISISKQRMTIMDSVGVVPTEKQTHANQYFQGDQRISRRHPDSDYFGGMCHHEFCLTVFFYLAQPQSHFAVVFHRGNRGCGHDPDTGGRRL